MVPSAALKLVFIVHRTFHNAVLVIRVGIVNRALIQTAKDLLPAIIIIGGNGNIGFRAVVYRFPFFIVCAGCQAALELDVDLSLAARSAKIVLTICIISRAYLNSMLISVRLVLVKIAVTSSLVGSFGSLLSTISPSTMLLITSALL